MPLSDDFLLTQLTVDFVDGPKPRARLYADPDDVRGRGLDVIFLNVQQTVDMTGASVLLYWQHDQAPALRGLEPFEAVEADVGRWKVHYPPDMGRSAGTVSAKIMVGWEGHTASIPIPTIEVMADRADPSATPSDDNFSVLGQLVLDYQRGKSEIDVAIERIEGAVEAAQDVADRAARGEFDGKGLELLGSYGSVEELEEAQPSPSVGDSYAVGGDLYVYGEGGWSDQGPFHGPKGDTGQSAGFGTITATVGEGTGEPTVTASWEGPDTAKDVTFEFDGLKGERGADGTSVTHEWRGTELEVTSASGTSSADLKGETGEPGADGVSCTHEWEGTTLSVTSASGTSSADLKGETGPKGDRGEGLNILDSYATYEEMTGAHPEGERVGEAYMVGSHYYVWNGSEWRDCGELRGAKGDTGAAAGFGEVTAEVGADVGTPSVIVETSGTAEALDIAFSFDGLKGEDGLGIKAKSRSSWEGSASELEGYVGKPLTDNGTFFASLRPGDLYIVPVTVTDQNDAPGFFVVKYESHEGMTINGTVMTLVYGPQGPEGMQGDEGPMGPEGPKGDTGDPMEPDQKESLLKEFLLAAHPVGSYYWSDQPTSPQTLFGGTWQAVEGRFVWAKSSSESVNSTGGAKTVTLSTSEMPSHTHTGPSHSHSLNSHTHTTPSHTHSLNSHTHTMSHSHTEQGFYSSINELNQGWNHYGLNYDDSAFGGRVVLSTSSQTATAKGQDRGTLYTANYTGSTGSATGSTGSGGSDYTGAASGSTGTGGTGNTGSAGSGSAHENMPPYVAAYCWKRTA